MLQLHQICIVSAQLGPDQLSRSRNLRLTLTDCLSEHPSLQKDPCLPTVVPYLISLLVQQQPRQFSSPLLFV
jgi:hypothetical protein